MRRILFWAIALAACGDPEAMPADATTAADANIQTDASVDAGVDAGITLDADTPDADAALPDADAAISPPDADIPPADASTEFFGATGFVLGPNTGYAGGGEDRLLAAALDQQQRIVAAGYSKGPGREYRALLVRHLPDGTADPTFGGGDGVVLESFSSQPENDDRYSALAVDAQDRILVAGKTSLGIGSGKLTVLARYTASGELDQTFGDLDGAGPARLGYVLGQGDANDQRAFSGYDRAGARPEERFNGIDLDSQGRILAAGLASEINADYYYRTLIVRFTADGALDPSFNTGGFVIGNAGLNWQGYYDEYISVRATAGDIPVAVGWTGLDSSFADERTLIAKYTDTGILDFSRLSGPTSRAGGGKEVFYSLSTNAAGQLTAAGFSFEPSGSNIRALIERFNAGGDIDLSFGSGGYILGARGEFTGANIEYLLTSAVDSRGMIVAAGFSDEANSSIENNVDQAFLLRYSAAGALDTAISTWTNGSSELAGGTEDSFYAVVIAPGDEIYAAGTSGGRALIVRYRADGCLDGPGPCTN